MNLKSPVKKILTLAYDVIDEIARLDPNRRAMIWCNDAGSRKNIYFCGSQTPESTRRPTCSSEHGIQKRRHGNAHPQASLSVLDLPFWRCIRSALSPSRRPTCLTTKGSISTVLTQRISKPSLLQPTGDVAQTCR